MWEHCLTFSHLLQPHAVRLTEPCPVLQVMGDHSLTFIILLQVVTVRLSELFPVCVGNEGTLSHFHHPVDSLERCRHSGLMVRLC